MFSILNIWSTVLPILGEPSSLVQLGLGTGTTCMGSHWVDVDSIMDGTYPNDPTQWERNLSISTTSPSHFPGKDVHSLEPMLIGKRACLCLGPNHKRQALGSSEFPIATEMSDRKPQIPYPRSHFSYLFHDLPFTCTSSECPSLLDCFHEGINRL